jgi:hypothetical protein
MAENIDQPNEAEPLLPLSMRPKLGAGRTFCKTFQTIEMLERRRRLRPPTLGTMAERLAKRKAKQDGATDADA